MLQIPAAGPVYHNRERDAIRNFTVVQLSLLIEIYSGAKFVEIETLCLIGARHSALYVTVVAENKKTISSL